jgi:hypothetical protein
MPSRAQHRPRLVEGQVVTLEIGGEEGLPCRVIAFHGADMALLPIAEPGEEAREALATQAPAYLVVQTGRRIDALRGTIEPAPPGQAHVVVRVTDGFRLDQRRAFSRAPIELGVELRAVGEDGAPQGAALAGTTVDVSAGGARVAGAAGAFAVGAAVAVALELEGGRRVEGRGEVVGHYGGDAAIRFDDIAEEDRRRLLDLVLRHHRDAVAGA